MGIFSDSCSRAPVLNMLITETPAVVFSGRDLMVSMK